MHISCAQETRHAHLPLGENETSIKQKACMKHIFSHLGSAWSVNRLESPLKFSKSSLHLLLSSTGQHASSKTRLLPNQEIGNKSYGAEAMIALQGSACKNRMTLTSSGSRGPGFREVLTAQNRQPRVQVSPMSMMVAVAVCPSAPPQHSPMLGQRASSHTVLRPSLRRSLCILVNFSPPGSVRFNQSGLRVFSCRQIPSAVRST